MVHRIKIDEKAGICITTHILGGLSVIHLFSSTVLWALPQVRGLFSWPNPLYSHRFSNDRLQTYVRPYAHCEYDNGYLVFDNEDGEKEVWRLASDFATEGEVAAHAPPNDHQMDASARATTVYHQYAPRGQFRAWALLVYPCLTRAYRLAYPTLICASFKKAFLHDVRTGALVKTIDISAQSLCYVDVNERHAFVCQPSVVRVYSRESGSEILRIPADAAVRRNRLVEDPAFDKFVTPLTVSPKVDKSRPRFIAGVFSYPLVQRDFMLTSHIAHVSRDGRDLVVLSETDRVVFIRDFERVCRGETSLEQAGLSLSMQSQDECCYLGFEHGRVCVATVCIS